MEAKPVITTQRVSGSLAFTASISWKPLGPPGMFRSVSTTG